MCQITTFMDSGDKDFPKGRRPAPPRPFAGLRHCCTSSQGWVSRAFGWCRTRVTQCSSPTAVAVWLGRHAAWRSAAQSVPRTQPERRESGSGANSHSGIRRSASAVDCRAVRKLLPILGPHFSHLQSGRMTSEESFRANLVVIQTLVLGQG